MPSPAMPSPAAVETVITNDAPQMATRMLDIAEKSHSEEAVRHNCNSLIEAFLKKTGLAITGHHDYALKGGRIDSKYGGVILEYKDPKGSGQITDSPDAPGTKKVTEQIKKRFRDFETEEGIDPQRLFGVGCDGRWFVFVRYRGGQFQVEAPKPVTAHTVERLLRAFCSVFSQWRILFGEVCGNDVYGKNEKINKLAAHYGLSEAAPAALLFAIHTYYTVVASRY